MRIISVVMIAFGVWSTSTTVLSAVSTQPSSGHLVHAGKPVNDDNVQNVRSDTRSTSISRHVDPKDAANVRPNTTGTQGASDKLTHNRVIEELIVTAEKRKENIQDVPISIQAFSGNALAARGIKTTAQLGQAIPSLQFTQVGGFTLINLRGVGTDNFVPSADPSISTYIDGIYVPNIQGATVSLGDVERVEVLKGPQGTLFGRDSTGGAVNIINKEPGDTFEGSAELEGGNYGERAGKLDASGPVTSWLSAGLSAAYSYEDSYYTNVNYDTQSTIERAGRLKLRIHPLENLTLDLTGLYAQQQGITTTLGKNTNPSLLGSALGIQPESDDYVSRSDYLSGSKPQQDIFYGKLTWNLPWFDLKLLGSDEYILAGHVYVDFDGSPQPLVGFYSVHQYVKLQTGEFQVVSNDQTPLADHLKWVFGLYYLHSVAGVDPVQFEVAPQVLDAATSLGLPIPVGLTNLLAHIPVVGQALNLGVPVSLSGVLATKSYSTYAQATYNITNWLDLTLGGRYQYERRFLTKALTGVVDPTNPGSVIPLLNFPLDGRTATNFSPKAVLSAHLNERTMVYASYSVGYKSGTFNIVNIYTPPSYIAPEKVTAYELGFKGTFFDGALQLDAALFDNRIRDLQSGFVSLLSGGAVQFLTVPSARTRGVDFDGTLTPLPTLDPGLVLTGNAAYVDAIYTNFPSGPGFQRGTGLYSDNLDLTGNQIARAPKFSGGAGIVQSFDVWRGSLEVAMHGYYNSGFYYDAYNTVRDADYYLLASHVSYLFAPWNVRVTAFGKNLLGRRYHESQFQTDFGIIKTLAAPREYELRVNWQF